MPWRGDEERHTEGGREFNTRQSVSKIALAAPALVILRRKVFQFASFEDSPAHSMDSHEKMQKCKLSRMQNKMRAKARWAQWAWMHLIQGCSSQLLTLILQDRDEGEAIIYNGKDITKQGRMVARS